MYCYQEVFDNMMVTAKSRNVQIFNYEYVYALDSKKKVLCLLDSQKESLTSGRKIVVPDVVRAKEGDTCAFFIVVGNKDAKTQSIFLQFDKTPVVVVENAIISFGIMIVLLQAALVLI
mmetsp:Transcript_11147/g.8207  ORF Transcript_11147/g.8207 Transcript_11147/m.8207 type:complete len:118 (+) Transcript_11147:280-633(+)